MPTGHEYLGSGKESGRGGEKAKKSDQISRGQPSRVVFQNGPSLSVFHSRIFLGTIKVKNLPGRGKKSSETRRKKRKQLRSHTVYLALKNSIFKDK